MLSVMVLKLENCFEELNVSFSTMLSVMVLKQKEKTSLSREVAVAVISAIAGALITKLLG